VAELDDLQVVRHSFSRLQKFHAISSD